MIGLATCLGARIPHEASAPVIPEILRVAVSAFPTPLAGEIRFTEFSANTYAPLTYLPANYTDGPGPVTVNFSGGFVPQSAYVTDGSGFRTWNATPSDPLTLNNGFWYCSIFGDGAAPFGRTLVGLDDPTSNAPAIALFATDVLGLRVDVGFCNAVGNFRVRALSRTGEILGTWFNVTAAYEPFCIVDTGSVPRIAAITVEQKLIETAGGGMGFMQFTATPYVP